MESGRVACRRGITVTRSAWPIRYTITLLVTIALATACAATPHGAAPTPSRSPETASKAVVERMLREHAEEHNAGVIARVETHGKVWRLAAGVDQHDRPVDPRARFDIGSTAKAFEATVALQLVEEGRFSLDDSVQDWLPRWVQGAQQVLIRHLLNHTSGLVESESGSWTPITDPGTTYSYSNGAFGLIQKVIHELTDRSFDRDVRDRILEPLGLDETWRSPQASSRPWLGAPYGSCRICVPPEQRGGPISTTADLARFFKALVRGELVGDEVVAEMMTGTVPTGTEISSGLGLFRFDLPCGTAYGYGGDLTYYTNQVLVSPDGSTVVVVARNVRDWFSLKILAEEIYCRVR